MSTKSPLKRTSFVRQTGSNRNPLTPRHSNQGTQTRRTYNARTIFLPTTSQPRQSSQSSRTTGRSRNARQDSRFDISFNLGRTAVKAPALTMPRFDLSNPRWVSGLLTLLLGVLLIYLWSASSFTVAALEATGNIRLSANQLSMMSGMVGEPIFKAVPEQIIANLRTAFPDLAVVKVRTLLPNRIEVEVVERTPLIAWYQNGGLTWIDAEGIAFQPQGEVAGLVQVASNGSPRDVEVDLELPAYEQRFIEPETVQALLNLEPFVPEGMLMIFDPIYGLGWQDPRGWDVQIGHDTGDLPMKLSIYQAMVEQFISQGIQPSLVSMEFLDAPFYK